MQNETPKFEVIVLGIILDPTKKKILIGRRESDPYIKNLDWCFPGGRLSPGEDIDQALKKKIKLKTGYSVKNIGTFFSRTYDENPDLVSISFLTKVFEGEENPGDDIVELKWVSPKEIETYFKVPMHKKLKEFLLELI
jgi:8-oxo-dGTP diphosphatase